jgi:hypothetical protein
VNYLVYILVRLLKETPSPLTYFVPCFSLNTILTALDITNVDYFSLDVEGNELNVLKSLKFDRFNYQSFTIEHNGKIIAKRDIKEIMAQNGYLLMKEDNQDFYYIKK